MIMNRKKGLPAQLKLMCAYSTKNRKLIASMANTVISQFYLYLYWCKCYRLNLISALNTLLSENYRHIEFNHPKNPLFTS